MNKPTKPYASTLCDFVSILRRIKGSDQDGSRSLQLPMPEHCGYTLIDNLLVPETFIQRVISAIENCEFQYGTVLSKECLFDKEFLFSLDEREEVVLMPVVLQLVASGKFPLNLSSACDQDDESESESDEDEDEDDECELEDEVHEEKRAGSLH